MVMTLLCQAYEHDFYYVILLIPHYPNFQRIGNLHASKHFTVHMPLNLTLTVMVITEA